MNEVPISILFILLMVCLALSAFFSASETAMMALNRYKLKHLAEEEGVLAAKRAQALLKTPDRLIGTILLGNNFVNIAATSIGTMIGIRLLGDLGVLIATIILTVIVLIFSEVTPKTLAAIHSQLIAFPASLWLTWLVKALYPLVALINFISKKLLACFGVSIDITSEESISHEELKTIVSSSSQSPERQDMLMGVLELEDITVSEAMVQRNELEGIDLNDDLETILHNISASRHGRLIAYRHHLDEIEGMLHVRDVIALFHQNALSKEALCATLRPCIFVPDSTPLRTQLLNFQKERQRSALVVDEYGDLQGLITLEDILSHIVGDIGEPNHHEETPPPDWELITQHEQSALYRVNGLISLRTLNRELGLKLPLDGPNTLSGLIIETLGNFPEVGQSLSLERCVVSVLSFSDGVVEQAELTILPEESEE
ncbi:MAG: CNNM domain-containing protein [Cardiobacteriaceae bacterium]|nr:CNNM domain-containing protein [Cardiobacteriaceae bacterium]